MNEVFEMCYTYIQRMEVYRVNSKKVAVMAGTPIDTAFGEKLITSLTTNTIALPISHTPSEQTYFQSMCIAEKERYIHRIIKEHTDISCLIVYCNSLSSSIDFDKMARTCGIPIITPLQYYQTIARQYQAFGILSANAQGSAGIERVIVQNNRQAVVHAISSLAWVNAIEQRLPPEEIIERYGLEDVLSLFACMRVDCIVLGCTHFPYFIKQLQERTKLTCIHSDEYIVRSLQIFLTDNMHDRYDKVNV